MAPSMLRIGILHTIELPSIAKIKYFKTPLRIETVLDRLPVLCYVPATATKESDGGTPRTIDGDSLRTRTPRPCLPPCPHLPRAR